MVLARSGGIGGSCQRVGLWQSNRGITRIRRICAQRVTSGSSTPSNRRRRCDGIRSRSDRGCRSGGSGAAGRGSSRRWSQAGKRAGCPAVGGGIAVVTAWLTRASHDALRVHSRDREAVAGRRGEIDQVGGPPPQLPDRQAVAEDPVPGHRRGAGPCAGPAQTDRRVRDSTHDRDPGSAGGTVGAAQPYGPARGAQVATRVHGGDPEHVGATARKAHAHAALSHLPVGGAVSQDPVARERSVPGTRAQPVEQDPVTSHLAGGESPRSRRYPEAEHAGERAAAPGGPPRGPDDPH